MNLLPKASGSRPRLACEIFPGGVVAAGSPEPGLPLATVARVALGENTIVPSLKPGNIADRVAVVAAVRRTLEQVASRSATRNGELTLIIPDAAVRVLLLDFDTLPTRLSEALPIVRFRLKKLVPFDADHAMVSFQVMSISRSMVRVLAVAIPRDVLSEYESLAREAGYEPGAVLPSTLAALAAVEEGEGASLVVNAHAGGVTTAIVRAGIVLLHRTLEFAEFTPATPAGLPPALFESSATAPVNGDLLPLIDRDNSHAEWAAQEPLSEYGRNPYADGKHDVLMADRTTVPEQELYATHTATSFDMYGEAAPVSRSPYASPLLQDELSANFHHAVSITPPASDIPDTSGESGRGLSFGAYRSAPSEPEPVIHELAPDAEADEIARAVSVAVAYFEDSLAVVPGTLLSAGPLGAEALNRILSEQGVAGESGVRVRELVDAAALAPTATSASVPRSWLAGVTGALKS